MTPLFFFLIIGGYIIGSIPTGYILAKTQGKNIQEIGSGNIGATNLTRVLGKKFGFYTLLGDGIKAFAYSALAKQVLTGQDILFSSTHMVLLLICTLFILLGNCYSLFLGFSGGKGGVTTFAVFLALTPFCSLLSIITYVIAGKSIQISAAGTLSSVSLLPVYIYLFYPENAQRPYYIFLAIGFGLIVFIRHKKNITEMFFKN